MVVFFKCFHFFNLSKFLEPVAFVNRNHILASDVINYRKIAFELGGPESRITHSSGGAAMVLRLTPKKYILLDGQRRFVADCVN